MSVSSHSILALGFSSPWLLTGLAGAAIPVIIHLLSKRRYRESEWAAMRFLLEAARKHSRRLRWEQLLLLLVRCLAIALLALAFSRPFFSSEAGLAGSQQTKHLILVIDDTYSMGFESASTVHFARAKEMARDVIDSSQTGDAFSIIGMTNSPDVQLIAPTFRKDSILAQLEEFALTEETANITATFARVQSACDEAPQITRKEIVFIGDFQKRDWDPASRARREQLQSRVDALSNRETHVSLLSVANERAGNLAVESLEIEPRPMLKGQNAQFVATIRRFGELPEGTRSVELVIDGRTIASKPLAEPIETTTRIEFDHVWPDAGEKRLLVQVRDDSLELDNRFHRIVTVRDELRVLFVEGRAGASAREQSSFYLRTALETLVNPDSRTPLVTASTTDLIGFRERPLDGFDAVCLCNVAGLRASDVDRLLRHLAGGKGLLILLGDTARPDLWNDNLKTLFPDSVLTLRPSTAENVEDEATGFLVDAFPHPIVNAFGGNPGTGLETAIVWKRNRLESDPSGSTNMKDVLRFEDGSPALLEVALDRGRALVSPMSWDAVSGSWAPLSGSFPPVVIEAFRFLVAGENRDSHFVGNSIEGVLPEGTWTTRVRMTVPSGDQVDLRLDEQSPREWSFEDVARSGFYELDLGLVGVETKSFSVNCDTRESDLETVSVSNLRSSLFDKSSVPVRASWTGTDDSAGPLAESDSALISALLWLGLGLLVCEVAMAWNFVVGVCCLGLLCLSAGVVWAANWTSPAASVSTGILVLALVSMMILKRTIQSQRSPRGRML